MGLRELGIRRHDRVAIYLNKRIEAVVAALAVSLCGGIFVNCNPLLKGRQVRQILADCGARGLISSRARLQSLDNHLNRFPDMFRIAVDGIDRDDSPPVLCWRDLLVAGGKLDRGLARPEAGVDNDVATIFYTSGSTGAPKGVVVSHRNLVVGAHSVAEYLENTAEDCILALLPLGFDAGFSQLTTAFCVGARVILHDYISAADTARTCDTHGVTGLTAVPHTFSQLLRADWPQRARNNL
ncbi:MAG: acyl-CoA ligase (AMP-forming), exosortase A system-associated, partial [Alphaproteobacteria bacterium]